MTDSRATYYVTLGLIAAIALSWLAMFGKGIMS